jgi:MFS family permease
MRGAARNDGANVDGAVIESDVPARMDRLPWSRWHLRIVVALGTSWILDGLEVTLVGSLSGVLESKHGLSLSDQQVTGAATVYLAGAVIGALLFGRLTDRYGRRRLFLATLATYSIATLGTAFSVSYLTFALARFCTGLGIGGEYAAINSAVDELIPGRIRGRVDLFINGTFWVGASLGAAATLLLLGPHGPPHAWGWRLAFGIGGVLGFGVLLLRLAVPESPRWLMLRGREAEARAVVDAIEREVRKHTPDLPRLEEKPLRLRTRDNTPWAEIFEHMLGPGRSRSVLGLVLMVGQAFFFNAMFFTFGLVAKQFYHQSDERLPLQLLPFAIASFLGPAILGPYFDRIGRKPMISGCYAFSGIALAAIGGLFAFGMVGLHALTASFAVIFFVASAAASAAYLTVSEIFPLEIRALAIAIFYALGTLIGGVGAPLFFGSLIAGGSRAHLAMGYLLGAALMLAGALCEHLLGVEAAGKSLESISRPLQSVD